MEFLTRRAREFLSRRTEKRIGELRAAVVENPLSVAAHKNLGSALAERDRFMAAHGVFRSMAFLSSSSDDTRLAMKYLASPTDMLAIDHNQHYRMRTVVRKLRELSGPGSVSVLDVGGGEGKLAQFIPDDRYFLVEPSVNGLTAARLPFANDTFDYAVACHVFEHIPPHDRAHFLDGLMACARRGVILLNPFFDARQRAEKSLRLFIEITDAPWAHEHMSCTLPTLEAVKNYAAERQCAITVEPNGFMPFTEAVELANYFCGAHKNRAAQSAINAYFNELPLGSLDISECPTAYLACLTK